MPIKIILFIAMFLQSIGLSVQTPMSSQTQTNPERNPQQSYSSGVVNRLPIKSKDCTPGEEKWWNDIRSAAGEILKSNELIRTAENVRFQLMEEHNQAVMLNRPDAQKLADQLEQVNLRIGSLEQTRLSQIIDYLGVIKTGATNGYNPPVDDTKLIVLTNPRPYYTEEARKNKITGRVLVEGEFQPDGHVANARVITGLGYGLDEKAVEAVNKIVFLPVVTGRHFQSKLQKISVTFALI